MSHGDVPLIVEKCIAEIEKRGLEEVGIYRVPGAVSAINRLRLSFNSGNHPFPSHFVKKFDCHVRKNNNTYNSDVIFLGGKIGSQDVNLDSDEWKDINVVAGALKQFLRELPEAVMTSALYDSLIAASGTSILCFLLGSPLFPFYWVLTNTNIYAHVFLNSILALADYDERLLTMKDLIRTLPPPNYILLKRIIDHLERVTDYEEFNHMYATNLAIVFGPTLLRPGGTSANSFATSMKNLGHQQNIVRNMILQYHWLFDVEDEEEGAAEEVEGDGETEESEAAIGGGQEGVDDDDEDEENEFPEILEDSDEDEYEEEEEVYVLSAAPSTPLTPTFTSAAPNVTTTMTVTTGGGGGALKENNDRAMKDQRRKTIVFG